MLQFISMPIAMMPKSQLMAEKRLGENFLHHELDAFEDILLSAPHGRRIGMVYDLAYFTDTFKSRIEMLEKKLLAQYVLEEKKILERHLINIYNGCPDPTTFKLFPFLTRLENPRTKDRITTALRILYPDAEIFRGYLGFNVDMFVHKEHLVIKLVISVDESDTYIYDKAHRGIMSSKKSLDGIQALVAGCIFVNAFTRSGCPLFCKYYKKYPELYNHACETLLDKAETFLSEGTLPPRAPPQLETVNVRCF